MGLFKSMKDMAERHQVGQAAVRSSSSSDAGYKPGMGGQMAQMGDMIGQASEQMKELNEQTGRPRPHPRRGDRGPGRDRRHGHA